MKKIYTAILVFAVLATSLPSIAQTTIIKRDPEIAKMVNEISAENLEKYVTDMVSYGTRNTLSTQKDKDKGVGAAMQYVLRHFQEVAKTSNGRMTAEIDEFVIKADGRRIREDLPIGNVMATLKGTDPNDDRVFIISGHLDSRASNVMNGEIAAPGANDDGSGVAAVMELARIMATREFPATILFVAVTGEEQGLKGARYLAEKAKTENWNITAMLNNDMIGNSSSSETNINDNTRLRVFSEGVPMAETDQEALVRGYTNGENDSKSRQLARYVKEIGERYVDQLEVKLIYRNDRFLRGGDHTAFAERGFTAVRLCEMNENYNQQHQDVRVENGIQYGDLVEFVDFEYVRKASGVNLATLASLAMAPEQPQNVGIDVRVLGNATTLRWEAPKTGTAKGYYVLMRETDQSVWEKKFFTTDTMIELPYSKDNYFFAVQAVGANGHESLAVFPRPITR
ncbi:M20/M25/M40 family metallo-hydrolase [Penaeicola halotolerans]|uniref:M20/M25/M40 family metallo-hydrolase n=1 Tax=Penaeicola halotolerans TaxID=2793196 RepID=UPI001CF8F49A|nr:M20/M25/M40 family metallo-hydrolase [Penaeicola halotolerans]